MNWSTLNITIETPMFLGGAIRESCQPDTQFVPSVRGALRSWFRALVGATTTSPAELLRLEGSVFGAATDDGGGGQSQVHIRLGKQRATVNRDANTCPRWLGPNANDPARKWLGYLLGQGLFTPGNQDEAARLRRDYVDAGQHLEQFASTRGASCRGSFQR